MNRYADFEPAVGQIAQFLARTDKEGLVVAGSSLIAQFQEALMEGRTGEDTQALANEVLGLTYYLKTTALQQELSQAVFSSSCPPIPRWPRNQVIQETLKKLGDGIIPALVGAGFTLDQSQPEQMHLLAQTIGMGRWPHPELLCPDILLREENQSFFDSFCHSFSTAMLVAHIKKVATLPIPEDMCERMSQAFGSLGTQELLLKMSFARRDGVEAVSQYLTQSVGLMRAYGWLDPALILARAEQTPTAQKLLQEILEASEQHWLDYGVGAATGSSSKRVPRL